MNDRFPTEWKFLNERFFSIHGFQYVQQLVDVMNKQERNEKV